MLNFYFRNPRVRLGLRVLAMICATLFLPGILLGQSTPGTGGIRGMVFDPTGAPLADAKVTITNKVRSSVVHVTTSSAGVYSSGPLEPGEYTVRVEKKGFNTEELLLAVHVAEVSGYTVKLEIGERPEVAVPGPETGINYEQPTVQSMLRVGQLETYPLNGRNYFDLTQLVPGVQFQDAGILDPGKTGFSSVSFEGQFGRDARVEVDGVSISDETVGSVAQNIPASAILEFNVSQASLDLPTETTSSGVVNIATRSGGNELHGEAFGFYLGHQGSAALPGSGSLPFQREQFGARAGGAIIKDKVFWFLDAERLQQNVTFAEPLTAPFNDLGAGLSEPLREVQGDARLDWQRREDAHAFYRLGFDQLRQARPFGAASSLQEFQSETHAPSHTLGYDFDRGLYTHSFRFEYLRSGNGVTDYTGTIPAGLENPIPGLGINIGAPVNGLCALSQGGSYCSGPSPFAPQSTFQSSLEFRYDGSRVMGGHIWRYGITYNRIHSGQVAALFTSPQVGTTSMCLPNSIIPLCNPVSDPTAYPADFAFLGNGIGFSTAQSAFGYSGGGLGPDNQIEAYGGDSWKLGRTFSLTYGVRYIHDTGRVDSGLGSLTVLNQWQPGLSNPVRNPDVNFAPQFGFAWDAGGTGRTLIRAGAGLYYASSLWNDTLLDSRARSAKGLFADTPQVCAFGVPTPFTWPGSLAGAPVNSAIAGGAGIVTNPGANQVEPTFCGSTISTAGSPILALSSAFQAAAAAAGSGSNVNYVANSLSAVNANGLDVFSPNYRTPRSYQMNLGVQEELRPGTVLSVDYIRQIGEHSLLILDPNHSGAARSYNYANAVAARDNAQVAAGCPTGYDEAQCMVYAYGGVAGAQAAYSAAGLDSNSATTGGGPCSFCAFPGFTPAGINNNGSGSGSGSLGTLDTLSTVGRSVYSAYQAKLMHRISHPMQGIREANFQVAYAYSKYVSQSQDQNFPSVATDNDNPLLFTGPNSLDRKHQFSLAGTFDLIFGIKLSMIAHLYSPLPESLLLPELTNGGEIYATDWIGSGLGSGGAPEPVRGTQIGQFNRKTNVQTLSRVINTYNLNFAGTLTPAGACLVANEQLCPGNAPIEVLTQQDMLALNWVMPDLPSSPYDAWSAPWLKTLDLKAAWPIKVGDRFVVEPSASIFNVFNFANAFQPGNMPLSTLLPGPNPDAIANGTIAPNAVGGVIGSSITPFRAGFQSGTFALGAPRQLAFGLKISF
ncbi:MAG TPA: carboxypeptidase-like regulatory domain-containing protein [Terriglobales bacterium]|nr:carboxypeptidase-like regulatory domain-containing protein [Terriglobales bacterium]